MVGIAGKSQGCTTCRRRKVRCDQAKPSCAICNKSGRQCEGYEKYPVFLNKTADGFVKRGRLEETKIAGSQRSRTQSPAQIVNVSAGALEQDQVMAWFCQQYCPSARTPGESHALWLLHAVTESASSALLHRCLLSISVRQYARAIDNEDMVQHGARCYSHALNALQHALSNQSIALGDDTFASVRTMVLYEFLESTSDDRSAWARHLNGVETLLCARRPEAHRSGISRAVFEDIRYPLMMQAIMQRRASAFGEKDWISEPWNNGKSLDQRAIDHGFALASVLERVDALTARPRYVQSFNESVWLLRDASGLFSSLDELEKSEPDRSTAGSVRSMPNVLTILTLHALQLLVAFVLIALSQSVKSAIALKPELSLAIEDLLGAVAVQVKSLGEIVRRTEKEVKTSMMPDFGQYGPSRALFPLNGLLYYHRRAPEKFKEMLAIKSMIASKQQMKFARDLNRGTSVLPYLLQDGRPLSEERSSKIGQ